MKKIKYLLPLLLVSLTLVGCRRGEKDRSSSTEPTSSISQTTHSGTSATSQSSGSSVTSSSKPTSSITTTTTTSSSSTTTATSASTITGATNIRFIEADHLTEGYHVVFTGGSYEMNGAEWGASQTFTMDPIGGAVFEVVRVSYPVWAFRLIEVADETYAGNIDKYLCLDGTKITLSSTKTEKCEFSVTIDSEKCATVIADNGYAMIVNGDSHKFTTSSSGHDYDIYIYRDRNVNP